MEKHLIKKGLVLAVILLFIVVSFQPIIAKDTISLERNSNTKQVLFETIHDIANNKEFQDIIKKYEGKRNLLGFQNLQVSLQKEIINVIENNDELNKRLEKLLDLNCDCENEKTTAWKFPILCTLLLPFWYLFVYLVEVGGNIVYLIAMPIFQILNFLAYKLDCYWLNTL